MDSFIIILLLLIIATIIALLFNNQQNIKPKSVKKDEIISNYTKQMKKLIKENQGNKDKLIHEKKLFLQQVNSELSRNLFFEENEAKEVLQKLASM